MVTNLILLALPVLATAGPFHPYIHGFLGYGGSDGNDPGNGESCLKRTIRYEKGEVTAN